MSNEVRRPFNEGDRSEIVERVQEAYVLGLISYSEMDTHLQAALTATTRDDAVSVIDALPAEEPGRTVVLTGTGGRLRRRGRWRVPRVLRVESVYGNVDLDLSKALFDHPIVDLVLILQYGRARLTLPTDAEVDFDNLRAVWKQPTYKPPKRASGSGPTVRISGTMEYGRLTIRHKTRKQTIRDHTGAGGL